MPFNGRLIDFLEVSLSRCAIFASSSKTHKKTLKLENEEIFDCLLMIIIKE